MVKKIAIAIALFFALASCERGTFQKQRPERCLTGIAGPGEKVLPTTAAITPTGTQIPVGSQPQGMALSPAGDLLLVTENGMFDMGIRAIDPIAGKVLGFKDFRNLFIGIAFSPNGKTAYVSGGTEKILYQLSISGQNFSLKNNLALPGFAAGLTVSPSGIVFVALLDQNSVIAVDPSSWTITRTFSSPDGIGQFPWTVGVSPDGENLLVLNRGAGTVTLIPLTGSSQSTIIPLGEPAPQINPSSVAFDPQKKRCYIANTNTDTISEINLETKSISWVISLSPYLGAPYGSSPVSIALSPDGKSLYIALAGENTVAVVDTVLRRVTGKIPSGWYPSSIALSPDGKRLYIANMKGEGQGPHWPPTFDNKNTVWGVMGTISLVDIPDEDTLAAGIIQVRNNNCFQFLKDEDQFHKAFKNIHHVVYIFRENKTFDQIFGDVPSLGEPYPTSWAYFYGPRTITPNIHYLAERYTLVPNFYSPIEVSVQGHIHAVAGTVPDWTERLWPLDYGAEFPGRIPIPISSYNNRVEAYPVSRFIFDRIVQAGLTFSNFGEFLSVDRPELQAFNVNVDKMTDVTRAKKFLEALDYFESNEEMPSLVFITLPNDHCPPCFLAMNDLATAMIIEKLSKSSFWKESLVIVTEDDPQPGWDHIDTQRMFAVLIGPYVKRGYMSPRRYSFPSVLKTIEMILGITSLSLNDANTLIMSDCFTSNPDFSAFNSLPVPREYWAESMLKIKSLEKKWCRDRDRLFPEPHPLCTGHKFPSPRYEDD